MNDRFLRHLRVQFRVQPNHHYSAHETHFRIFDRDGEQLTGFNAAPPGGIRNHWRILWQPRRSCEVYVYGGASGESATLELRNLYTACRDRVAEFIVRQGGTAENLGHLQVVRVNLPLTRDGAEIIGQLADIVRRSRKRLRHFPHRMAKLAKSLDQLQVAVALTADSLRNSLAALPSDVVEQE